MKIVLVVLLLPMFMMAQEKTQQKTQEKAQQMSQKMSQEVKNNKNSLFVQPLIKTQKEKKEKPWTREDWKQHYNPRKPIWIPILESIGANLILGSYNRYVTKSDFAQISFTSIKNNFKNGWNWDADQFFTNMWQHPFQGSVYFNTARTNGYGYWTSMLVTAIGSLQWEYFMETEPPSINDLITTTLQGAIFGEVFYRISSLLIDETTEDKRVWRELGVAGFNPARGLNRVIYGRSWRDAKVDIYSKKPYFMNMKFGAETGFLEIRDAFFGVSYLYGDKRNQTVYKPMDIFSFDMEVEMSKELTVRKFKIYGILLAKSFKLLKRLEDEKYNSKFVLSLFNSTDYYENRLFNVGAVTLGGAIDYISPKLPFNTSIIVDSSLGFLPMGAVNSDYAEAFIPKHFEEGRDYNFSIGFMFRHSFTFMSKYVYLRILYNYWYFYTIQGAEGVERIQIFEPELTFNVFSHLQLGISLMLYYRHGKYVNFEAIRNKARAGKLFLAIRF